MSCPRCEGFIIHEYLVDPREGSLSGFHGWRCVNCGAIGYNATRLNRKRLFPVRGVQFPIAVESCSSDTIRRSPPPQIATRRWR